MWAGVLKQVESNTGVASWVKILRLTELSDNRVTLQLRSRDQSRLAFIQARKEQLESIISDVAGYRVRVDIVVEEKSHDAAGGPAGSGGRRKPGRVSQDQINEVMNQPLVKHIAETFDVRFIDLRDQNTSTEKRNT